MAINLDEYLTARQNAAKSLYGKDEDIGDIKAKRNAETKSSFKSAGSLIGGIVGAYYGQPALGAQIGGQAGGLGADMLNGDADTSTLTEGSSLWDSFSQMKDKSDAADVEEAKKVKKGK